MMRREQTFFYILKQKLSALSKNENRLKQNRANNQKFPKQQLSLWMFPMAAFFHQPISTGGLTHTKDCVKGVSGVSNVFSCLLTCLI
jgi:hypothetical protein